MASSGVSQSSIMQQQQQQSQQHYNLQSQSSAPAGFPMMQQSPAPTAATSQMTSPTKDYNSVNMCHVGQEIVHEIVSKAQEIFNFLTPKHIQLPNNQLHHQSHHYNVEKSKLLEDHLRQINVNFRRLRVFYTKVNEAVDQVPENPSETELIPFVGSESEPGLYHSDAYRVAVEQHREMVEQVRLKNQELKEIVDSIRSIIWEINTMITMRKTL